MLTRTDYKVDDGVNSGGRGAALGRTTVEELAGFYENEEKVKKCVIDER